MSIRLHQIIPDQDFDDFDEVPGVIELDGEMLDTKVAAAVKALKDLGASSMTFRDFPIPYRLFEGNLSLDEVVAGGDAIVCDSSDLGCSGHGPHLLVDAASAANSEGRWALLFEDDNGDENFQTNKECERSSGPAPCTTEETATPTP